MLSWYEGLDAVLNPTPALPEIREGVDTPVTGYFVLMRVENKCYQT